MVKLTRRYFLRSSGIVLAGLHAVPGFLQRAAGATTTRGKKKLVVLFQRGAVDGLNMVVPHGEKQYYDQRKTIAIPRPGASGEPSVIDLDGLFGFHPALAPLKPLYDDGLLAAVHAAGSPESTRSHFDAQDFMESGTPGRKGTPDGWLNRYLQGNEPRQRSTFRAVSVTTQLPRILLGSAPTLAIPALERFGSPGGRRGRLFRAGLESLYAASEDEMQSAVAAEAFEAVEFLERADPTQYGPENGARYPAGELGENLLEIAQLIKADVGLEIAFAEMGGWDHHVNEGASTGQLAGLLRQLAGGLAAFARDLGDRMEDVVVITLSEFGRTVAENGTRGTDHGHATCLLAMGGPVRGGKVYGEWPGLEPDRLFEGRDLALTTDFRDVVGEVLVRHLGARKMEEVFPGHAADPGRFRNVIRV